MKWTPRVIEGGLGKKLGLPSLWHAVGDTIIARLTQVAILAVVLGGSLIFKVVNEFAYETAAVFAFAFFFAVNVSITRRNIREALLPAALVAFGALILMPGLYGSGTGIAATHGFEKLFLFFVGAVCLVVGGIVIDRK